MNNEEILRSCQDMADRLQMNAVQTEEPSTTDKLIEFGKEVGKAAVIGGTIAIVTYGAVKLLDKVFESGFSPNGFEDF